MPLTDVTVKNAKPREKLYRLFDTNGLYLEITPTGAKYFRLKYRFGGKEKRLALGVYPVVTLKEAREKTLDAKKLLSNGTDPAELKKSVKIAQAEDANTFELIAREWHEKFSLDWTPNYKTQVLTRMESDVFPYIGARPVKEISAPELLAVLRRMEARGVLESARRMGQCCGQVFRYAVATGRAERDPSADLRGALPPVKQKHHASITDTKKIGELLRAIDGYQGSFTACCALKLAPLVFVRPGELYAMPNGKRSISTSRNGAFPPIR